MRVLVLSSMYPNSIVYLSGVFVHEQVKAMKKLGVDFKVVAPVPYTFPLIKNLKQEWKLLSRISRKENYEGIEILHSKYLAFPGGYFKPFWSFFYLLSLLKNIGGLKRVKNYNLIHAHGSLPNDYSGYLLAKLSGLPLIITVHGESIYYLPKHPRKFKYSLKALSYADAIVTVSSKVKDRVKKYLPHKNSLYTIYNGFKLNSNKVLTKQRNDNILEILYAGNLIERKGTEYLIKAFYELQKKYTNIVLKIAGGGELYKNLKSLATDLQLRDKIIFTNSLTHSKMLEEISGCDIFIMPSWDEAFGVVYLEALSFKKPIIGTEGEGISDFIEDGLNGFLVKPRNVESIIEKLSLLIENESLRKKFGEIGFKSIEHLTWELNASENIKVYKQVLEANKNE